MFDLWASICGISEDYSADSTLFSSIFSLSILPGRQWQSLWAGGWRGWWGDVIVDRRKSEGAGDSWGRFRSLHLFQWLSLKNLKDLVWRPARFFSRHAGVSLGEVSSKLSWRRSWPGGDGTGILLGKWFVFKYLNNSNTYYCKNVR